MAESVVVPNNTTADLKISSENLTKLKILHDFNNVHSVMVIGFQSNVPIYGLSARNIVLQTGDNSDDAPRDSAWQVMSFRDIEISGGGREYICLCYPPPASHTLKAAVSTVKDFLSALPGISLQSPHFGGGAWSSLVPSEGDGPIPQLSMQPPNGLHALLGWGSAFALMQTKLQYYRDINAVKASDFPEKVATLPVFYMSGATLLSSTIGTLMSLNVKTVGSSNSNASLRLPVVLDPQRVWQSRLSDYLLTGTERPRTLQMINASMWRHVFEYKTSMPLQFLGAYDLTDLMMVDPKDPDFILNVNHPSYLLYRAFFDMNMAPNPWKLSFGSLG